MSSLCLISLALSVECDANENREKKWLREILLARSASRPTDFTRPVFPCGLFMVSLDGLSERRTTGSLHMMSINLIMS